MNRLLLRLAVALIMTSSVAWSADAESTSPIEAGMESFDGDGTVVTPPPEPSPIETGTESLGGGEAVVTPPPPDYQSDQEETEIVVMGPRPLLLPPEFYAAREEVVETEKPLERVVATLAVPMKSIDKSLINYLACAIFLGLVTGLGVFIFMMRTRHIAKRLTQRFTRSIAHGTKRLSKNGMNLTKRLTKRIAKAVKIKITWSK